MQGRPCAPAICPMTSWPRSLLARGLRRLDQPEHEAEQRPNDKKKIN
jgi:hypothetical protein